MRYRERGEWKHANFILVFSRLECMEEKERGDMYYPHSPNINFMPRIIVCLESVLSD